MSTYNKRMSDKYGWTPEWFGCDNFGEDLKKSIQVFQKEHHLDDDGYCGPATFRRIFNARAEHLELEDSDPKYSDYIICHGEPVSIEWDKVVLWTDKGGLKSKEGNYRACYEPREIDLFVNHWDVCLSSKICHKVLNRRGISVHFLIDNDGTIYQCLDTNHIAWHAGSANNRSVGVEIANAYYPKYQSWYVKNGFGERDIVQGAKVRGNTLRDHLDFYPVQKEALKALWKAINKGLGVPLETPENFLGGEYTDTLSKPKLKAFSGFIHHYHESKKKIDCGGLNLVKLLKEIKSDG